MTLTNILDAPEVRHTLAALPDDPQLAALREKHDAQDARLALARTRPGEIDARIAAIDRALIDADDKARRTLLGERSLLREERLSLPTRLAEEARRYVYAELATLARLAALIRPYGVAAAEELAPIERRAGKLQANMVRSDGSYLSGEEKAERRDAGRVALLEVAPTARTLNERIRHAQFGLSMIAGYVDSRYGERTVLANPNTYAEPAEAYGRQVVRAFERSA